MGVLSVRISFAMVVELLSEMLWCSPEYLGANPIL